MGSHREDYERRRAWSDQYLESVKEILGRVLFTTAPIELDLHHATDIVFRVDGQGSVAVRVRRKEYLQRYRFQVTFRSITNGGLTRETEIDKVIDGHADWMLYGFGADDRFSLVSWTLIDLNAFRAAVFRRLVVPVEAMVPNGDGTFFDAYDFRHMLNRTPRIIVDSSEDDLRERLAG
jgi:hypothetical protein